MITTQNRLKYQMLDRKYMPTTLQALQLFIAGLPSDFLNLLGVAVLCDKRKVIYGIVVM
jgi:hypothetical protein